MMVFLTAKHRVYVQLYKTADSYNQSWTENVMKEGFTNFISIEEITKIMIFASRWMGKRKLALLESSARRVIKRVGDQKPREADQDLQARDELQRLKM